MLKKAVFVLAGLGLASLPACNCARPCGPQTCNGCCDTAGKCQPGNNGTACGISGRACLSCQGAELCTAGQCTGGGGGAGGGGGGSGGGAGGGGGGSGLTFEQFCSQWLDATCSRLISCKQAEASAKADCLSVLGRYYCDYWRASFQKGYLTFDGAAGSRCLSEVSAAACDKYMNRCGEAAVRPNSDLGQGCLDDMDCKPGPGGASARCAGSGCGMTCQLAGVLNGPCLGGYCFPGAWCDRTANLCRAPQPAGSSCTSSSGCDGNSYCDTVQELCVALPTDGQPCRTGSPRCAESTWCDYSANPDICRAKLGAGMSCSSSDACLSTAFCDFSKSPAICELRRGQGGSCTSLSQCQDGLRCSQNLCVPLSAEGQPCRSASDCQPNLTLSCDNVLRTCLHYERVDAGAACSGNLRNCQDSYYSCKGEWVNLDGGVGTLGTCLPMALNDPCRSQGECPKESYCTGSYSDAGVCAAASTGSPCSYPQNCPANHYCSSTQRCAAQAAQGQPCGTSYGGASPCLSPHQCLATQADGGGRICAELGSPSSACIENLSLQQCKFPLECLSSVCTPIGHDGERCSRSGECINGACTGRDAGVLGTCGPLLPAGSTCSSSYDCASHRCEGKVCQSSCL